MCLRVIAANSWVRASSSSRFVCCTNLLYRMAWSKESPHIINAIEVSRIKWLREPIHCFAVAGCLQVSDSINWITVMPVSIYVSRYIALTISGIHVSIGTAFSSDKDFTTTIVVSPANCTEQNSWTGSGKTRSSWSLCVIATMKKVVDNVVECCGCRSCRANSSPFFLLWRIKDDLLTWRHTCRPRLDCHRVVASVAKYLGIGHTLQIFMRNIGALETVLTANQRSGRGSRKHRSSSFDLNVTISPGNKLCYCFLLPDIGHRAESPHESSLSYPNYRVLWKNFCCRFKRSVH